MSSSIIATTHNQGNITKRALSVRGDSNESWLLIIDARSGKDAIEIELDEVDMLTLISQLTSRLHSLAAARSDEA